MSKYVSKHNVADVDFVECPYCPKGPENQFKMLHHKHLKGHETTLECTIMEFPNLITMTLKEKLKKREATRIATEVFTSNVKSGATKNARCFYDHTPECSHEIRMVHNYESNEFLCKTCNNLKRPPIDLRSSEDIKIKREKTFQERYGSNITNAKQASILIKKEGLR